MSPIVSNVLPCYNGAGFLAQSIDSVNAQTFAE
ncbi:MAG: glycosyltransferase [Bacteroidales bacterium]|nr:glycosyltransferase [Bacteroidales bacterium]